MTVEKLGGGGQPKQSSNIGKSLAIGIYMMLVAINVTLAIIEGEWAAINIAGTIAVVIGLWYIAY